MQFIIQNYLEIWVWEVGWFESIRKILPPLRREGRFSRSPPRHIKLRVCRKGPKYTRDRAQGTLPSRKTPSQNCCTRADVAEFPKIGEKQYLSLFIQVHPELVQAESTCDLTMGQYETHFVFLVLYGYLGPQKCKNPPGNPLWGRGPMVRISVKPLFRAIRLAIFSESIILTAKIFLDW